MRAIAITLWFMLGLLTGPENFGLRFLLPKPEVITPETSPEIQLQGVSYLLTA